MYYYRARVMNPGHGRFTGKDPFWGWIKKPLSLNLYLYVLNLPTLLRDRFGKQVESDTTPNPSESTSPISVGAEPVGGSTQKDQPYEECYDNCMGGMSGHISHTFVGEETGAFETDISPGFLTIIISSAGCGIACALGATYEEPKAHQKEISFTQG